MDLIRNDIAVLILFFEKLELTKDCIASFLGANVNVYILNNHSSEESFKKLKVFCQPHPKIKLYSSDKNLGPAGGRNYLINQAHESWFVFVDNDIIVTSSDWINTIEKHILQHPDVQIFVPLLYNSHEKEYATFHSFKIENKSITEAIPNQKQINCFPGGASIVHRDIFQQNGIYDDRLFAFEDYEFSIRCLVNGKELHALLIEDIVFDHRHKYHKKKVDKQIVLQRYNNERLTDAIKLIEEKHKIQFNHYWQWWVDKQIFQMTKANLLRRVVNFVRKYAKIG